MNANVMVRFVVFLIVMGLSGCLGSGDSTTFSSKSVQSEFGTPTGTSTKQWQNAQIFDIGAVDLTSASLNRNQNQDLTGLLYKFPMAVFNTGAKAFHVVFNRADDVPTGMVQNQYAYATAPHIFDADYWAASLNNFVRIDGDATVLNPGADSLRPLAAVDSVGTAYAMVFTPITENATTFRRPLVSRRSAVTEAWSSPSRVTRLTETGDVLFSGAIGVDSYNNAVVVFRQNMSNYFNQYRPFLGWRFPAGTVGHVSWHDTAGGFAPLDLGMDIGFDGYGNGYAVYINSTATFGAVKIVRWKGDNAANFVTGDADTYQSLTTPATIDDRYPRVLVYPSGGADVFFYRDFNGTTGASLYAANAADTGVSTAATFSTEYQFDSGVGVGLVTMFDATMADPIPPIVSTKNGYGAVGFIKSDGSSVRFYVSRRVGGAWTTPSPVDNGIGDVTWGAVSVNYKGDVAVAYSAIGTDTFEHVYGTVYSTSTSWGSVTQLDSSNTRVSSVSATEGMRPSVSIDELGNAVATFTVSDSASYFAPARRRAVAATFR